MGPSRFSVRDRHLIPASPRTPATCAAGQVTTIVRKAKLTLPFSFELFRVKPVLVLTNLKGQVPRLWNCPTATATESSSVIHESVGNPSSKLPRGVRRGSTTGLQGMEKDVIGGGTSACQRMFNSYPPHNRRTRTHTHQGEVMRKKPLVLGKNLPA